MKFSLKVFTVLVLVQAAAVRRECTTQLDCEEGECCFDDVQDRNPAYCTPLGTQNSECEEVHNGGAGVPPCGITFACPCQKGFVCKGNGVFDPIRGAKIGRCERKRCYTTSGR